jgi:hypothetical protein
MSPRAIAVRSALLSLRRFTLHVRRRGRRAPNRSREMGRASATELGLRALKKSLPRRDGRDLLHHHHVTCSLTAVYYKDT